MDNQENISIHKAIPRTSNKLSTKTLVLAAIFASMNIILTRVGSIMLFGGSVRLGFGNVPLILSGLALGPLAGAMTGLVSDLLGVMINSHGAAIHPGFTLSSILTGALPALIVALSHKKRSSLFNVVASNIAVLIIVSLTLNTYWLSQLQGQAYLVLLPARAVSSLFIATVTTLIIYPLMKSLVKTGLISDTAKVLTMKYEHKED